MTYLTDEAAAADPVELYEFIFGTQVWRFTDSDAPFVHPGTGDTYTPEPLSRGQLQQSSEDGSMSVDVILDASNPLADFFRSPFLPAQQLWLSIYRGHVGSADVATLFKGRAGQCIFDKGVATLTCIPTKNALSKTIPVQLVQILCTNTLYDQRCKLDPAAFSFTGVITAIVGLLFSIHYTARPDAAPTGYCDGGYIQRAGLPAATILDDTFTLGGALDGTLKMLYNPGYAVADTITIAAGCDKRLSTCTDKFHNVPHYQGFAFFPIMNPFADEIL